MAIQNAKNADDRFDVGLSSVSIDGKQVLKFAPGEEPWTATPQADRNTSSADSFGSGVNMIKHGSPYQFTLNVTAFDPVYQDDILDNIDEFCSKAHTIDAVNQIESFHADYAYLPREAATNAGNSNANRPLTFNTNHGDLQKAPK